MGVQGIVADGTGSQLAPVLSGVLDICRMGGWAGWSQGVAPAIPVPAACALPVFCLILSPQGVEVQLES